MNLYIKQLDERGIKYQLTEFPKEIFTSEGVAGVLNIKLSQVAKAMVVKVSDDSFVLALLPGDKRLNLKALSRECHGKKVVIARREETERVTRLPIGAITPLIGFVNPAVNILVDESLIRESLVNISAGDLRWGVTLDPSELVRTLNPQVASISE